MPTVTSMTETPAYAPGDALYAVSGGNSRKLLTMRVTNIAAMTAILVPTNGMSVEVTEAHRGGLFVFVAADESDANSGTTFKATDATTGSWTRRYHGPVHVTWYGADPTGATDSTAAFNLATRAAYVSTGNFDLNFPQAVFAPPGQYRITGQVWIHKGQHLFGAGEGATRIRLETTGANVNPIFMLGYNSISGTSVSDGGGLPPEISNLWAYGGPSAHAVVYTGVAGAKIHDLFMTSSGVCLEVFGTDTRVTNCQLDGGLNAIKVGGHTHVFSNILIFNMNYGIITMTGSGGGCSEIVFDNVHFNYQEYNAVQFTAGIDHRNLNFNGCNFVMNEQYATFIGFVRTACTSAQGIAFNGCHFNNMDGPAYVKTSTGLNNRISFNDCLFSGAMTSLDYTQSTTARAAFVVNEQVWFNNCEFVGLHNEPIWVNGGSSETRVIVNGGTFRNATGMTALVEVAGTAPTGGGYVQVQGMDFDRHNVPVVVESELVNAWRVSSDRAIPITGQGATQSNIRAAGHNSVYLVDTTTAAATINLPRSDAGIVFPRKGDQLEFIDAKGTWNTNNVTFVRGDNNINGAAADYVANQQNGKVIFVYEAGGWRATGGIVPVIDETVTTTNVITAAESGKTFYLHAAGGFTSTLPAPALGLNYKFMVRTAPTTSYIITTNAGDNLLSGTYLDVLGDMVSFAAQDTITFVGGTALYTDSLEVHSDGAGWHCRAFSRADGGITVSVT